MMGISSEKFASKLKKLGFNMQQENNKIFIVRENADRIPFPAGITDLNKYIIKDIMKTLGVEN